MSAQDATPPSPGKPERARPWRLGLLLVALALLAGATVFPWWTLTSTSGSGFAAFEFHLGYLCLRPSGLCTAYGPLVGSQSGYRAVASTFGVAFVLVALAIVVTFLAVLLELASGRRPAAQNAAPLTRFVAGVTALIAIAYVFVALPGAFSGSTLPYGSLVTGFFGGTSGGGVTLTFGGSLGWGMALAGGVVLVLASGFRPRRRRSGPPPT